MTNKYSDCFFLITVVILPKFTCENTTTEKTVKLKVLPS